MDAHPPSTTQHQENQQPQPPKPKKRTFTEMMDDGVESYINDRLQENLEKIMQTAINIMTESMDQLETRLNRKVDELETKLNTKVDQLETRLNSKVDELETRLSSKVDQLGGRVNANIETFMNILTCKMFNQLAPKGVLIPVPNAKNQYPKKFPATESEFYSLSESEYMNLADFYNIPEKSNDLKQKLERYLGIL